MANISSNSSGTRYDPQCNQQPVEAFLVAYRFAISVVFLGTVAVVGIIGNAVTFLVLKTDKRSYKSSSSTTLILLSLAVFDALFALSSALAQVLPNLFHLLHVGPDLANIEARIFPFAFYFGSAVRMMRNWTIVLVSIERWIAIFKPLHAPVICTVKKAKVAVLLIVMIAAVYNVPRFVEATPIAVDCGNYTKLLTTRSPLRTNWAYQYVYMISLYMIFVIAGPMLVLMAVNFLLMRAIWRAAAERERLMGSTSDRDAQNSIGQKPCGYMGADVAENDNGRPPIRAQLKGHNGRMGPASGSVSASLDACRKAASSNLSHKTTPQQFKLKTEITRMCVGIIVLYILCELPALIYQIMFYMRVSRSITVYIQPISNALVSLNSALNFFVYVFLGKRFRKRVSELLWCGYARRNAYSYQSSDFMARKPSELGGNSAHSTIVTPRCRNESDFSGQVTLA